jgi:hypothetical protein
MSQLSLFADLSPISALPTVLAPRPCRCGCVTAILGSSHSVHAGRLICNVCGTFLGWASHAFVADIRGSDFVTGISSFNPGTRP